jgi:hypothetical protein
MEHSGIRNRRIHIAFLRFNAVVKHTCPNLFFNYGQATVQ